MKAIRLIPDDTKIDFIRWRFFAYVFSIVVSLGTIALTMQPGLNFGIDFTGGTIMEIRVSEKPDLAELRARLNALDIGSVALQEFGEETDIMIRLPQQHGGPEAQKAVIDRVRGSLDEKFGEGKVEYRRVEYVGPQVGEELKMKAVYAVLFSLIGILGYLWFRFEWQFAVGAIIATGHDVIATIGFFAVTQTEFDLSTLAAVLTIAGYSINDTVVVYDRLRENLRKYKKMPLKDVMNFSINQTLSRTILTGGTTLLTLIALWIFGGEVIRGFVYALIFGILIGTFSSIYVASPVLLYMNLRRETVTGDEADADAETQEAKA